MTLLTARFNQVDTSIAQISEQIAALQVKLSNLQAYRQQLQAVEQACESALSQVDQALLMLGHVDPDQVATFKAAIDVKFSTEAIANLPASPETEVTTPFSPEPAPTPDIEAINTGAIEVTVITETEPQEEETAPTTPASNNEYLSEAELNSLSIQLIRKLASAKKVRAQGTRAQIAANLAGQVTEADIDRITTAAAADIAA